jgi:MauM/NapG family ferredoxin protein
MKGRRRSVNGAMARRIVQVAALLLFFGLVLLARRRADAEPESWLQLFFLLDPLVLLLTWLAAHAVPPLLWLSLITVVVTLVFGRVFCGWFCPLGTIHALAGRFLDFCWPRRRRPEHWSRWQLAKYYLLVALVLMAACGVHWGTILDPLVLLYRTTTTALLPGLQWAVEDSSYVFGFSEPAREFLREHVTEVERQAFVGGGLILTLFVVLLALNRVQHRFWCRYLCPLGALLGVFSLRPLLRRQVEQESCNQCDICGLACHGSAAAAPGDQWNASECLGCLNCTPACVRGSVRFTVVWPWDGEPTAAAAGVAAKGISRSRRGFLRGLYGAVGAAAGGVAGMFLLRATPQSRGSTGHADLIRPPGALAERAFLERCTACGMCMRVCPTGCLQPAWSEAGLEGLWTPRLVARIGRCEYDCTLCGQVCPTGAIARLTLDEKHEVRLGIAVVDQSKCIPYAFGRACGTCVEACPISPKAISLVMADVQVTVNNKPRTKVVGQPVVDPDVCIGCGGCVKDCTFRDEPAIHVVAANESRHPEIKPFLDLRMLAPAKPAPAKEGDVPAELLDPYGK